MSVVGPVLAAAIALLLLATVTSHALRRGSQNRSHPGAPDSSRDANISDTSNPSRAPAQSSEKAIDAISLSSPALETIPGREQFSAARDVDELEEVIDGDHPEKEKLGVALATLEHPDKQVRDAALEAVRGLDDRSAIPRLQELAAQTDDPANKAALLDVADFLNLPSLTEYMKAHPGTGQAKRTTSTTRTKRVGHLQQMGNTTPADPGMQSAGQP